MLSDTEKHPTVQCRTKRSLSYRVSGRHSQNAGLPVQNGTVCDGSVIILQKENPRRPIAAGSGDNMCDGRGGKGLESRFGGKKDFGDIVFQSACAAIYIGELCSGQNDKPCIEQGRDGMRIFRKIRNAILFI